MATSLRLGIAGLGTVGGGVLDILAKHQALVAARAGRPVEVVAVAPAARARTAATISRNSPGTTIR